MRSVAVKWAWAFRIARNEFNFQYAGAIFGVVWAFVNPLLTFAVFWAFSSLVMRMPVDIPVPYYAFLLSGLVPWMLISEGIAKSVGVFTQRRFLFNVPDYDLRLPCFAVVLGGLFVHIPLIVLAGLFFLDYIKVGANLLLLPLGIALAAGLLLGLSMVIAALARRFNWFGQLISPILLLLFWVSPIIWDLTLIPADSRFYALLNPVALIVQVYRFGLFGDPQMTAGDFTLGVAVVLLLSLLLYIVGSRLVASPALRRG